MYTHYNGTYNNNVCTQVRTTVYGHGGGGGGGGYGAGGRRMVCV